MSLAVVFSVSAAIASPNASLAERQTLLGLTNTAYYVLSSEWEVTNSHFSHTQRMLVKQYDLNTNQLIKSSLLNESEFHRNPDTMIESVESKNKALTDLNGALQPTSIRYAGFSKHPAKPFIIDEKGMYVQSDAQTDYVLTAEELIIRIPDFASRLQYNGTKPKVVAIHSEYISNGKKRYFVVVQSGEWRSDVSGFEYVISLPKN